MSLLSLWRTHETRRSYFDGYIDVDRIGIVTYVADRFIRISRDTHQHHCGCRSTRYMVGINRVSLSKDLAVKIFGLHISTTDWEMKYYEAAIKLRRNQGDMMHYRTVINHFYDMILQHCTNQTHEGEILLSGARYLLKSLNSRER